MSLVYDRARILRLMGDGSDGSVEDVAIAGHERMVGEAEGSARPRV